MSFSASDLDWDSTYDIEAALNSSYTDNRKITGTVTIGAEPEPTGRRGTTPANAGWRNLSV